MSLISLVRHGQASFGSANYDRLSEKGQQQVYELAKYWLSIGETFEAVYSGSLERQRHTAQIVIDTFAQQGQSIGPLQQISGLDEFQSFEVMQAYLPIWQAQVEYEVSEDLWTFAKDRQHFQRFHDVALLEWVTGNVNADGVERWIDFQKRVHDALDFIHKTEKRKKKILIASSGGPIATLFGRALHLPGETIMRTCWTIRNSSITQLVYHEETLSLLSFNGLPHLAQSQSLITRL